MKMNLRPIILSDQDAEKFEKLTEPFDLQNKEPEVFQFVKHLEDSYWIRNFSILYYSPFCEDGLDVLPKFYGGLTGYHSAYIYLFLCQWLVDSASDKEIKNIAYEKLKSFCWNEIKRIEGNSLPDIKKSIVACNIFYFLDKLITTGNANNDLDSIKGAYNRFLENFDLFEPFQWGDHKILSSDSFIVIFEALINDNIMDKDVFNRVIVRHPKMFRAYTDALIYARDDEPCLIIGETGTGKEPIAKFIHAFSSRREKKFLTLNCGGFTDTLFESSTQGHVKGAFTGAANDRQGIFMKASGGTIFLDEINSLPFYSQSVILRNIQFGEVQPVGKEEDTKKTDVRVICAVNDDPIQLIKDGKFREDLYYRIAKGVINVPPLRELKDSFETIAYSFIMQICKAQKLEINIELKTQALNKLRQYDWPGNFRELENVLYRAVKRMKTNGDSFLKPSHIEDLLNRDISKQNGVKRDYSDIKYDALREEYLEYIRKKTNGKALQAEKLTGISRKTITRDWKKYDLKQSRKRG